MAWHAVFRLVGEVLWIAVFSPDTPRQGGFGSLVVARDGRPRSFDRGHPAILWITSSYHENPQLQAIMPFQNHFQEEIPLVVIMKTNISYLSIFVGSDSPT